MLQEVSASTVIQRCLEENLSGSMSDLSLRILKNSNEVIARSSFLLPLFVDWQVTDMGSLLSLQIRENPTVSPSTDPIATIQASLTECPVLVENYETHYWL